MNRNKAVKLDYPESLSSSDGQNLPPAVSLKYEVESISLNIEQLRKRENTGEDKKITEQSAKPKFVFQIFLSPSTRE